MTVRPGRPFWLGVTAFFSSMVSMVGVEKLSFTQADLQATWLGSLIVSATIAGMVYAKAKLDESQPLPRRRLDPPA